MSAGVEAPREDKTSDAPAIDVGDGGQVELGPAGGTNRVYLFFVFCCLFLCLADMGGRRSGSPGIDVLW